MTKSFGTVTAKYNICLRKEVREALGVGKGDIVTFTINKEDKTVTIRKGKIS